MIDVISRYKFVVQDRDRHGNLRIYLRQPGKPKLRLFEALGTDAFDAEYRRALDAKQKPTPKAVGTVERGTLTALVVEYYGSADFKRLDARSSHVRRLILEKLLAEKGALPAGRMEARHILKMRDAKAEKPEAANSLVKALRAVFKHGVAAGLVKENPARSVPYLAPQGDGLHSWTREEVEQFEAHWPVGSKPRLAMALMLFTGQRRSDVVLFGRQHVREGVLTFTQQKNRNRKPVTLTLPIIPELARIIAATPTQGLHFLTGERGTPYTPDSFGNRFRAWCRAAGLPQCSPHGLRKAAASRLAELGCSANEIAAVTGHRTLKEVSRYTAGAAQRVMAASAMARITAEQAAKVKVPPSAPTPEWDKNATQSVEKKGYSKWMVPRSGIEPPTLRFSVACSTN
ncbi:integrase [Humitalea rosea]|uniref:Integrase n=1 Tax=Humitalea rosea TaxID=990373 RepID=A0A2W7KB69_9PROT|nr:integrase [Humitalea rosea]